MNFESVHNNKQTLLLQCISGSRAYGLDTPQSDTDIKGVFLLGKKEYFGLHYTEQVANSSNDIVYYEVGRFVELLVRNNPNILELLSTPADSILYKHPVMDILKPEFFLSKLCEQAFAGYALTQIKKAKGLNKKIFNPVSKIKKTIIDFCYIIHGYDTITLQQWLVDRNYRPEECGLVKVPHAKDIYALFHQSQVSASVLQGIYSGEQANDVRLSSVPERIEPLAILSFNKDGYSAHCKDYREYWDWVNKRNDVRYENTLLHGKNYDAKNMMHTFRLLNMAAEIATEQKINVRRADRDFLLKIRTGEYLYDDLVQMVNERIDNITELYRKSDLPNEPDEREANRILVTIRESLYVQ